MSEKRYTAFFKGDSRYENAPIFKYKKQSQAFEYEDISYPALQVLNDSHRLLFKIKGDDYNTMDKAKFVSLMGIDMEGFEIDE
ncbi:hypothetical protein [Bacillus ndiopicus]|uniref:hypothetical protein n=1 Tax=Bacillus ndiopicus TaxID=1347368 RepID=UPI0005A73C13|nr:hypothetical protein [Bacillus ndiopicus]